MIDYDNIDLINNPKNPAGGQGFKAKDTTPEVDYDNMPIDPGKPRFTGVKQVGDVTDLGESQWDSNTPLETLHNVDAQRAELQPWTDQLGNALSQAVVGEIVGGTIEGLGYLLDIGSVVDVLSGNETEWGNFITEFGQGIREKTEENTRIYQDPNREEGFFNAMGDSGWWFSNSVSVASTLSMMIPTMAATRAASMIGKGLGVSRGLGTVRKAVGLSKELGVKGRWMQEGISQAVVSRNIENWMEAHGTFEDYKAEKLGEVDPETGVTFTEEKATKMASEAAASNWRNGWAMLAQDMGQYLSIGKVFNPISRKMEGALGNAAKKGITAKLKPWQQKVAGGLGTFLSEGGEESYQFIIAERAKLLSDLNAGLIDEKEYDEKMKEAFGSEELKTSAFFGGLGGNLFQLAGAGVGAAFKSKTRKEFEEKAGENYTGQLKNRAAQMNEMQQMLAQADQAGLGDTRKEIIDNMMMGMTAEALENDRYEQFYEAMEGIPKMSKEDKEQYQKDSGNEFDTELAAEYTPDILKTAESMRKKYLKHRNKFNPVIASKLTQLETQNERWSEKKSDNKKSLNEIHKSMGDAWNHQASTSQKAIWERKERGTVLRRRIKDLKAQKKTTNSKEKQGFIDQAIKINEGKLKSHAKETASANKARKNLDATAKEQLDNQKSDNEIATISYNAVKDDILSNREYEAKIDDQIIMNNAEMTDARSEEGQKRVEKVNEKRKIDELVKEEDINTAIKNIDEADYWTEDEAKEMKATLNKKLEDIETAKGEAEAIRLAEEHQNEMARKKKEMDEDPEIVDNQVHTPIGDVIEDVNAHEEPNVTEDQLEKSEKELQSIVGSGRNIALLDKVNGTEAFQNWNDSPVSKVGREFEYTVSEKSPNISDIQNDAIEAYNNAKAGEELPQSVYDNLPIKATLVGKNDIFTYLPTKPTNEASDEMKHNFKKGYNDQRAIIIDRLKKGLPAKTKVNKSSGGDLITEYDFENNLVPEHSILDLKQINNIGDVELMVSNEDGYLVDTLKEPDSDLGGTFMAVGKDVKRNKMPYRGGVFLKVKKANGQSFPLRLNLLKNTEAQAQLLAEMLIKIAVPVAQRDKDGKILLNEKGKQIVGKEVTMSTTISELNDELRAEIEENMGPELSMLDSKYKNPTLMDLVNTFIYVSDKTAGLTSELYIDGNDLVFGGDRINLVTRADDFKQQALIDFIHKKKRRQLNLNQWNSNPAYQKYVLDNKIINTNATTEGPLFQNNREKSRSGQMTGRRIQLYMEPLSAPGVSGPVKDKDGKETLSNQSKKSELAHEKGFSFSAAAFGKKPDTSSTTSPKKETAPKVSDTEIRNEEKETVSSAPKEISKTFVAFEQDVDEDFDDEFGDIEMGSAPSEMDQMDSGKAKKECKGKK